MASGRVNRTNRPNTWLHRPICDVKILLANSEPSTHGGSAARYRKRKALTNCAFESGVEADAHEAGECQGGV
jgi:hypothetical protein